MVAKGVVTDQSRVKMSLKIEWSDFVDGSSTTKLVYNGILQSR